MTPVMQTRYERGNGNCLTACVASVLDLPIDAVPEFCIDGEWFRLLTEFCATNGFSFLWWSHADVPVISSNTFVIVICDLEGTDEQHALVGKTRINSMENVSEKETSDGRPGTRTEWETEILHDPNGGYVPPIKAIHSYIAIGRQ